MLHIKQTPGTCKTSRKKKVIYQAVGEKENKQKPEKNRYGEDTQHVEKFIWHLKMIIGYKLIATMLTLSSPLADLSGSGIGGGGLGFGPVNGLNLYRQLATVNK